MTTVEAEKPFLKQLDSFWFNHGSLTTLGVYRILFGVLSTANLLMLASMWKDWVGERGFIPNFASQVYFPPFLNLGFGIDGTIPRMNIFAGVTNPTVEFLMLLGLILVSVFTMFGMWTRMSAILLAVGTVSLQHRTGLILHGGDTVIRVSALYMAVSPCGRACSIDRLWQVWRGRETAEPVTGSLWMQRLLCYQVAIVYFTTVWLKYWGSHWRNGTATFFTARLPEFYRFPVPKFMMEPPVIYLTTYGTLAVEFALATLVFFKPLRKPVLILGILMHGYIEYSMNIPLFAFAMCSMYVCFYEGEEVSGFFRRLGQRLPGYHLKVFIPNSQKLTERGQQLLKAADPLGLTEVTSGPTLAAENAAGAGVNLPLALTLRNPAIAGFALVPPIWNRILAASIEPAIEPQSGSESKKKR